MVGLEAEELKSGAVLLGPWQGPEVIVLQPPPPPQEEMASSLLALGGVARALGRPAPPLLRLPPGAAAASYAAGTGRRLLAAERAATEDPGGRHGGQRRPPRGLAEAEGWRRGFASSPGTDGSGDGSGGGERADAMRILQAQKAIGFRKTLKEAAVRYMAMDAGELVKLCRRSGAASTEAEAERLCAAFQEAGIVLRIGDRVLLRPQKVLDDLAQAVPALKETAAQTGPSERAKNFRTAVFGWGSVGVYFGCNYLFYYMCFIDPRWGWDAVEPLTYFFTNGLNLMAYVYFALTWKDFSGQTVAESIQNDGYPYDVDDDVYKPKKGVTERR